MGYRRFSPGGAGAGAETKRPEPKRPQDGTRRRPCRQARNDLIARWVRQASIALKQRRRLSYDFRHEPRSSAKPIACGPRAIAMREHILGEAI